ncbi:hypothetical protein QYZ88_015640 [Lachnospiraceae bacterium C1.1]|nr:hypothetical protein [Lachnospiraceae bacterium C1.1]
MNWNELWGCGDDYSIGIYSLNANGGYEAHPGNAMAASMVAGTAALVLSSDKKLMKKHCYATAQKVKSRILNNKMRCSYETEQETDSEDVIYGGLDVEAAVKNKHIKRNFLGLEGFRILAGLRDYQSTMYIARGKSIQLSLVDAEGNIISKKKAKGTYSLTTSSDGIILSKTGKLKVKKNVPDGTTFTVTASYDGESNYKKFCVRNPVTKIATTIDGKLTSTVNLTVSDGTEIDVQAPWHIINNRIYCYRGKAVSANAEHAKYDNGFGDISVKMPKDEYPQYFWMNGRVWYFHAKKGSKYTLIYSNEDGTNKKFKIHITCK